MSVFRYQSDSHEDEVIVYDDIYPKRVPGAVRNSNQQHSSWSSSNSSSEEHLNRVRARQRLREYRRLRARQRARRRKDLQVNS